MKITVALLIAGPLRLAQASPTSNSSIQFPSNATEIFGPYIPDDGPLTSWMSTYPDTTPLQHLNIPGTHETATWNYTQAVQDALANYTANDGEPVYPAIVFRCQRASIAASLNAGVRFFDLRYALDPAGSKLVFWHSQALLSEAATVGDVVAAFFYWLAQHATETIFLSFQYEGSTTANASNDATVQLMLFDILTSPTALQFIDQTHDALPASLGAARGKAVLFRRFNLDELPATYEAALPGLHLSPSDWTDDSKDFAITYNSAQNLTVYVEDYYEPDDLGDDSSPAANIAAKVNATVAHLDKAVQYANDSDSLFITFASAEHVTTVPVAVTPEIEAVGAANESTPLGGVNQQILPVLKKLNGQRMGIVVVDFWDQPGGLIQSILGM